MLKVVATKMFEVLQIILLLYDRDFLVDRPMLSSRYSVRFFFFSSSFLLSSLKPRRRFYPNLVGGFTLSDLLDKPWSQVSSLPSPATSSLKIIRWSKLQIHVEVVYQVPGMYVCTRYGSFAPHGQFKAAVQSSRSLRMYHSSTTINSTVCRACFVPVVHTYLPVLIV